jgi:hypothetical protein
MNHIIDLEKYYLINWKTTLNFNNLKLKQFLKLIENNERFIFIEDTNQNIKAFIFKNKDKKLILFLPLYSADTKKVVNRDMFIKEVKDKLNKEIDLVKFINTQKDLKMKIFISLEDIYNGLKERNVLNKQLYMSDSIHLLSGPNLDIFKHYIYNSQEQTHLPLLKKKNLFKRSYHLSTFYSYYYCYTETPINKIIVSGKIISQYPERISIIKLNHKNIEILKYSFHFRFNNTCDEYIKQLSKYICAFVSFASNHKFGILHKIYEVLSAGCLLLCPENHEDILKEIGLIANVNYMLINLNDNPNKTINFICNQNNKEVINTIRKEGFELATNKFNAENKYTEFLNLIKKIL